jgi:hypothetical protein
MQANLNDRDHSPELRPPGLRPVERTPAAGAAAAEHANAKIPRHANTDSAWWRVNTITEQFGRKNSMHKFLLVSSVFGTLAIVIFARALLTSAIAHERHQMQCTQTGINAIHADIQAIKDGKAKRTAMKEMKLAEDMMAGKNMDGCVAHMHNAVEAIEK